MEVLSRKMLETANIPSDIIVGDTKEKPVKIMQFGEGNFLRAFVDWMINKINKDGNFDGSVVVVQPLEKGMGDMINSQDGLYTLYLRGVENGEVKVEKNIITAIKEVVNPYHEWTKVMDYVKSPDLRFVVSNTTEAGIEYTNEPFVRYTCQTSYPGKLTALLYERFLTFNGDESKGLVIIPCELIERNGDNLKDCVMRYARRWELGKKFIEWLNNACAFMNTLVDRIVPGYPKAEAEELQKERGYIDNVCDTGEIFHFWVIEGDKKYSEELPFTKSGLNVLWTDNMEPYRTRKVRILNGAHTMTVLAAYFCGLETVGECMKDPDVSKFMKEGIYEEVIPTFDLPEEEKKFFAEATFERFENPFIRHLLLSISLNSVSKFKVRVLPSVKGYIERKGKLPVKTVFSLAALINFYHGTEIVDGKLKGNMDGKPYDICDNPDVLSFFAEQYKYYEKYKNAGVLVSAVLSNEAFWGEDLTKYDGLHEAVTKYFEDIQKYGTRAIIKLL